MKSKKLGILQDKKQSSSLAMMECIWKSILKSHVILKFKLPEINSVKACHLVERDCSIQRRHQKLVEETPSPFMTKELRKKWETLRLSCEAVKYEGVGHVEFLVDKHRNFYFMEMKHRIQVEHTITEEVINYDLIKEQIKIASGMPLVAKTMSRQACYSVQNQC